MIDKSHWILPTQTPLPSNIINIISVDNRWLMISPSIGEIRILFIQLIRSKIDARTRWCHHNLFIFMCSFSDGKKKGNNLVYFLGMESVAGYLISCLLLSLTRNIERRRHESKRTNWIRMPSRVWPRDSRFPHKTISETPRQWRRWRSSNWPAAL